MKNQSNDRLDIENYLERQSQIELAEIARVESGFVWRATSLISLRLRELGWTTRRILRHILSLFGVAPARSAPIPRPLWPGPAPALRSGPRVLIDVTDTARRNYRTGIQRVVTEIAQAALALGEGLPVVIADGGLRSYFRHPALPDAVELAPGDVLLLLDASWNDLDAALALIDEASRKGALVVACVYDVIPLLYPAAFHPDTAQAFRSWFDKAARRCDAIVAISQTVAEETQALLSTEPGAPPVGWFPLGGDFRPLSAGPASPRVTALSAEPFFLSVGTLEPRKGYSIALDAFEQLWAAGVTARYVIVGRTGWKSRALRRRIVGHPEFGRRLFWLADADDAELEALYRKARAVVAASFAEGFGLPLVEAFQRGAAVVASDIPVFREVAGDAAIYFRLLDAADLARTLRGVLDGAAAPGAPPNMLSWRASAQGLLTQLRRNGNQAAPRAFVA